MKKLSYTNFSIFISFLFIMMFIMILFNVFTESLRMNQLSKGFYTDHAVKLKNETDIYPSMENNFEQFLLYHLDTTSELDIRAIRYRGNVQLPPLREGHFFDERELVSSEHLAVIGENRKKEIEKQEGISYYRIHGIPYRVIGILGVEYASPLDNSVFVNQMEHTSHVFIVDQHKSTSEKIRQVTRAQKIEDTFSGYSRFFQVELVNIVFYISAFFIVLFMIMNINYFWLLKKQKEIGIQQMLGIKVWSVIQSILIEYFFMATIGILSGILLLYLCNAFHILTLKDISILANIALAGMSLLLSILLMIVPLYKVLKSPIVVKMKGLVRS